MTALVKSTGAQAVAGFEPEQVALIKRTIAKGADDDELAMFLNVCAARKLDPFAKEIYFRKYKTKDGPVVTFVTGIDGYRKMAEDSGKYDGQGDVEWCGKDGKWVDIWTAAEYPFAARVRVFRVGHREPVSAVAKWSEYFPSRDADQFMWKRMPANQLAKCAEALALRKAFPRQLGWIRTTDEMEQASQADPPPPARYIQAEAADRAAFRGAMGEDTIPDDPDPEDVEIPADTLANPAQIKAIHTMVSKIGLMDNRYRDQLWGRYKVKSSTDLTVAQASDYLDWLKEQLAKREARVERMERENPLADFADGPKLDDVASTGEPRAKLEEEIGNLMGQLGKKGAWFMTRFGKPRADMSPAELLSARDALEKEATPP